MAQIHTHNPVTYYDILEISPGASLDEIKQAYRKLAMQWHPDRNRVAQRDAHRKLQTINEAYRHLKDEASRARYDQMLMRQRNKLTPLNDNRGHSLHHSHNGLLGQFWSWLFATDLRSNKS